MEIWFSHGRQKKTDAVKCSVFFCRGLYHPVPELITIWNIVRTIYNKLIFVAGEAEGAAAIADREAVTLRI